MDQHGPSVLCRLPPLRELLGNTPSASVDVDGQPEKSELSRRESSRSLTGFLAGKRQGGSQEMPKTPQISHTKLQSAQVYPSPPSNDLPNSRAMKDKSKLVNSLEAEFEGFQLEEKGPSLAGNVQAEPPPGANTSPLTPSFVHYRPKGIPNVKSRKLSTSETQNSRKRNYSECDSPNTRASEFKIRAVKWDRTSDKGTAPLAVEPRAVGPRSCTLCYITKRKCSRTDGRRPNETHPCEACQKHDFVCQFISPGKLREGTTNPPSLESLKLHCDQAQRLRTVELEEQVVKLEYWLKVTISETRAQSAYIASLKLHQAVVCRHVMDLKAKLEEFDAASPLLHYTIPEMPDQLSIDSLLEMDIEGSGAYDSSNVAAQGSAPRMMYQNGGKIEIDLK